MTDWRHRALCRDKDPEMFFPIGTSGLTFQQEVEQAKAVCRFCPVIDECLADAIAINDRWAIRGGKTEQERRPPPPRHCKHQRCGRQLPQGTWRYCSVACAQAAECGKPAGVTGHKRRKEPRCEACRQVAADTNAARKKRYEDRKKAGAAPCAR